MTSDLVESWYKLGAGLLEASLAFGAAGHLCPSDWCDLCFSDWSGLNLHLSSRSHWELEIGAICGAGDEVEGGGQWNGSLGTESREWGSSAGRQVIYLIFSLVWPEQQKSFLGFLSRLTLNGIIWQLSSPI